MAAAQHAIENNNPLVVFTAGGGMSMQEGMISLNQMPRTVLAINELKKNKLPYIVVLTDPTAGGITASYAMLGDRTWLNLVPPSRLPVKELLKELSRKLYRLGFKLLSI